MRVPIISPAMCIHTAFLNSVQEESTLVLDSELSGALEMALVTMNSISTGEIQVICAGLRSKGEK